MVPVTQAPQYGQGGAGSQTIPPCTGQQQAEQQSDSSCQHTSSPPSHLPDQPRSNDVSLTERNHPDVPPDKMPSLLETRPPDPPRQTVVSLAATQPPPRRLTQFKENHPQDFWQKAVTSFTGREREEMTSLKPIPNLKESSRGQSANESCDAGCAGCPESVGHRGKSCRADLSQPVRQDARGEEGGEGCSPPREQEGGEGCSPPREQGHRGKSCRADLSQPVRQDARGEEGGEGCSPPREQGHRGKSCRADLSQPVRQDARGEEGGEGCSPPREQGHSLCAVCRDKASGNFFSATVCLPCKSFFIRCTKDGEPYILKQCHGTCDVSKHLRNRCQFCRFQRCVAIGMTRKDKPAVVTAGQGQELCRVCGDLANGIHFGVYTCEGCKKFFRRGLREHGVYTCRSTGDCQLNPRTRNNCRFCRYQRCKAAGMSREAIKMGRPRKIFPGTVSDDAEPYVSNVATYMKPVAPGGGPDTAAEPPSSTPAVTPTSATTVAASSPPQQSAPRPVSQSTGQGTNSMSGYEPLRAHASHASQRPAYHCGGSSCSPDRVASHPPRPAQPQTRRDAPPSDSASAPPQQHPHFQQWRTSKELEGQPSEYSHPKPLAHLLQWREPTNSVGASYNDSPHAKQSVFHQRPGRHQATYGDLTNSLVGLSERSENTVRLSEPPKDEGRVDFAGQSGDPVTPPCSVSTSSGQLQDAAKRNDSTLYPLSPLSSKHEPRDQCYRQPALPALLVPGSPTANFPSPSLVFGPGVSVSKEGNGSVSYFGKLLVESDHFSALQNSPSASDINTFAGRKCPTQASYRVCQVDQPSWLADNELDLTTPCVTKPTSSRGTYCQVDTEDTSAGRSNSSRSHHESTPAKVNSSRMTSLHTAQQHSESTPAKVNSSRMTSLHTAQQHSESTPAKVNSSRMTSLLTAQQHSESTPAKVNSSRMTSLHTAQQHSESTPAKVNSSRMTSLHTAQQHSESTPAKVNSSRMTSLHTAQQHSESTPAKVNSSRMTLLHTAQQHSESARVAARHRLFRPEDMTTLYTNSFCGRMTNDRVLPVSCHEHTPPPVPQSFPTSPQNGQLYPLSSPWSDGYNRFGVNTQTVPTSPRGRFETGPFQQDAGSNTGHGLNEARDGNDQALDLCARNTASQISGAERLCRSADAMSGPVIDSPHGIKVPRRDEHGVYDLSMNGPLDLSLPSNRTESRPRWSQQPQQPEGRKDFDGSRDDNSLASDGRVANRYSSRLTTDGVKALSGRSWDGEPVHPGLAPDGKQPVVHSDRSRPHWLQEHNSQVTRAKGVDQQRTQTEASAQQRPVHVLSEQRLGSEWDQGQPCQESAQQGKQSWPTPAHTQQHSQMEVDREHQSLPPFAYTPTGPWPQPQHTDGVTSNRPQSQHKDGVTSNRPQPQHTDGVTTNRPQPQHTDGVTSNRRQPQHKDGVTSNRPQPQHKDGVTSSRRQPQHKDGVTSNRPQPQHKDGVTSSRRQSQHKDGVTSSRRQPQHTDGVTTNRPQPQHTDGVTSNRPQSQPVPGGGQQARGPFKQGGSQSWPPQGGSSRHGHDPGGGGGDDFNPCVDEDEIHETHEMFASLFTLMEAAQSALPNAKLPREMQLLEELMQREYKFSPCRMLHYWRHLTARVKAERVGQVMSPRVQQVLNDARRSYEELLSVSDDCKFETPHNAAGECLPDMSDKRQCWKVVQQHIVRKTRDCIKCAYQMPGTEDVHPNDKNQLVRRDVLFSLGLLVAATSFFNPVTDDFRSFFNWDLSPSRPMAVFRQRLRSVGRQLFALRLDTSEAALTFALNVICLERDELEDRNTVERALLDLLNTFACYKAFLGERRVEPIQRMDAMFKARPCMRLMGVWHSHLMKNVAFDTRLMKIGNIQLVADNHSPPPHKHDHCINIVSNGLCNPE